jgi:DNA modification methylase
MEVYCRFPPKIAVLDPTMGWGGRLVGACALDLPKYIGIDANTNLDPLYAKMVDFLQPRTKTTIELLFQDALTVDYTKLKYDMVFTSPPYYNIEIYRKNAEQKEKKTKEEWDETFYKPLFERTWNAMQSPGYYVLNVPQEVYESSCVPILGPSHKEIELKKQKRGNKYTEFIYVWLKK